MDAQRTAEARIELVERRLTALQEAGIDTAGLASRLDVARRALAEGRAEEVPTICEDLLADARRLAEGGSAATRTARPVRTERSERSDRHRVVIPTAPTPEPIAAPAPVTPTPAVAKEAVLGWIRPELTGLEQRLDERINQLAPLITAIGQQVAQKPGIDPQAVEALVHDAMTPLLAGLRSQIEEQFTRLSATETRAIPRPGLDETGVTAIVEEALGGVRQQLEDRLASLDPTATEARLHQALERRLTDLAQATTGAIDALRQEAASRPTVEPQAIEGLVHQAVTPLLEDLNQRIADQFTRLSATETRAIPRPGLDEARVAAVVEDALGGVRQQLEDRLTSLDPAATEARLSAALERKLDARLEAVTRHTADVVAELRGQAASAPPTTPATVRVRQALASAIPEATANAVDQALAPLEHRVDARLTAMAETIGSLEATVGDLAQGIDQRIEAALGARLETVVGDGLKAIDATVAATVQGLVAQALGEVRKPDTQTIRNQVSADLRADLDFQMEQMAAEKGWVSINDVRAEVAQRSGTGGAQAPQPGFARLEAALVEFVRQTQAQQEQFLAVLKEKVERGTSIMAQQALTSALARLPGARPSSEAIPAPAIPLDPLDPVAPAAATDPLLPDGEHPSEAVPSAASVPAPWPAEELPQPTTRTLNALARGIPREPTPAAARQDTPTDPDLPPAGDLDALSHSTQEHALRDSQAAIPAHPDTAIAAALAAVEHAEAEHLDEHGSTRIGPATELHEDHPSDAMELDPVEPPDQPKPGAVLGLDNHETACFHASETAGTMPTPDVVLTVDPQAAPPAPAAVAPATTRTASAIEGALRRLVADELHRQVEAGLPALTRAVDTAVAAAVARHRAAEADHLQATIAQAVEAAVAARAPDPVRDLAALAQSLQRQAAQPGVPGDLRQAMVDLMRDPEVRQAVLEIVAIEAITNPGPLAELTGLRAFIRREIRQAGQTSREDLPSEVLVGT